MIIPTGERTDSPERTILKVTVTADTTEFEKAIERCVDSLKELTAVYTELFKTAKKLFEVNAELYRAWQAVQQYERKGNENDNQ